MNTQYLIIGSNNFWYSIENSEQDAIKSAKYIKRNHDKCDYADPESGQRPNKPKEMYIYKAEQIKSI